MWRKSDIIKNKPKILREGDFVLIGCSRQAAWKQGSKLFQKEEGGGKIGGFGGKVTGTSFLIF